jgi:predicted  nucleic acid-binding Zn-ribbon protein
MEDLGQQLGELRKEMRSGFEQVRQEIKDVRSEIKDVRSEIKDLRSEVGDLRSEMTLEFRAVRGEMAALNRTVFASMVGGFSSLLAALIVIAL